MLLKLITKIYSHIIIILKAVGGSSSIVGLIIDTHGWCILHNNANYTLDDVKNL